METNEQKLSKALNTLITAYNTGGKVDFITVQLVEQVRDSLRTEENKK